MSARELHHCPTCHAQSYTYWHALTPGLVAGLIKLRQAWLAAERPQSLHVRKDLDNTPWELTKGEAANWTKLRFHGLIAKDKDAGAGYWLITRRGHAFLRGAETVPSKVQTLNNHVVGHSELFLSIEDVMGSRPYFEDIATIERSAIELEGGQLGLAL